jgi:hypothetical protein
LCCRVGCAPCVDACGNQRSIQRTSRVDWLLGYRYVRLREGLAIREDLTSLGVPGDIDIIDSFRTVNHFHGVDIGVIWDGTWGAWSLEMLGKLALGNAEQEVRIYGETRFSGDPIVHPGGLLTQQSNIGTYRRNVFAVVPELGLTLGLRLTPRLRATLGYSFLYLSRVARPGEQIDRDVDTDQLAVRGVPPPPAPVGARPEFVFRDADFWAQGLNVGLLFTW